MVRESLIRTRLGRVTAGLETSGGADQQVTGSRAVTNRRLRSQIVLMQDNCKRFKSIAEALVAVIEQCAATLSDSCSLVQNARAMREGPYGKLIRSGSIRVPQRSEDDLR